jgi:hypothetical protein
MSTLSQPSLFSWKDFGGSPEIERLRAILDHLPDAALLDALVTERKNKRNDYPIEALWRSTIAGLLFGHQTTASLIRELERNGLFAARNCAWFADSTRSRTPIPENNGWRRRIMCTRASTGKSPSIGV